MCWDAFILIHHIIYLRKLRNVEILFEKKKLDNFYILNHKLGGKLMIYWDCDLLYRREFLMSPCLEAFSQKCVYDRLYDNLDSTVPLYYYIDLGYLIYLMVFDILWAYVFTLLAPLYISGNTDVKVGLSICRWKLWLISYTQLAEPTEYQLIVLTPTFVSFFMQILVKIFFVAVIISRDILFWISGEILGSGSPLVPYSILVFTIFRRLVMYLLF